MTETGIVAVVGIAGTLLAAVIASVFSPWVQDQFALRREKRHLRDVEDTGLFDMVTRSLDLMDETPVVLFAPAERRDAHAATLSTAAALALSELVALEAPQGLRDAFADSGRVLEGLKERMKTFREGGTQESDEAKEGFSQLSRDMAQGSVNTGKVRRLLSDFRIARRQARRESGS